MSKKYFIVALATLIAATGLSSLWNSEDVCALGRSVVRTCNPKCGACTASVKGTWTYYTQGAGNSAVSGPIVLVLGQSGYRVVNNNAASVTFVGTVFGNSIDFTLTVSGEEIEGYVNHCEGNVLDNKMFAVCDDRDGARTTFTALRQ